MYYTVRLTIRVRGTRRILKTFLRPEYAVNASSHATRFDTLEAAENAADTAAEICSRNGHKFIGADFFKVASVNEN